MSTPGDGGKAAPAYLSSAVKVHATRTQPVHSRPWVRERSYHSMGSGFVAAAPEGRVIVTNAHVVTYSTSLKVQKYLSDVKVPARIARISFDVDVAVLVVDDEDFWRVPVDVRDPQGATMDMPALAFGPLPELQDTVRVVGYPVFGTEISITKGVVSRIELSCYSLSDCELLSVHTDGSINPGNSGGPILDKDDLVVGIAFQSSSISDSDRVGQFIPNVVYQSLVLDSSVTDGSVIDVPGLSFQYQELESKAMRQSLGLEELPAPSNSGVYVITVCEFSNISEVLRAGDVIVAVEDLAGDMVNIGNQATVPFRSFRIGFSHLWTSRRVGDTIKVGVVRDRKRMDLEWTLISAESTRFVPEHDRMKRAAVNQPEYIVIAGIVFISLYSHSLECESDEFLNEGLRNVMNYTSWYETKENADHEVVLLSQVLDADVNQGYEGFRSKSLASFNGVRVNNLRHLHELYAACTDDYLKFRLFDHTYLVINRADALRAEAAILDTHNISAPANLCGQPLFPADPAPENGFHPDPPNGAVPPDSLRALSLDDHDHDGSDALPPHTPSVQPDGPE